MRNAMLLVIALSAAGLCAAAEVYPGKPVHIIVPYGPGSTTDFTARVIAQQLSEQLGNPFVVDNRTGANGIIGYGLVAKAAPDGYTLALADTSFSTVPGLRKSLPYDPVKDFTPITEIIGAPMTLVVRPAIQVNSLKEFIALAQAQAGKLNYGSVGVGGSPHLSGELFKKAAKVDLAHIPYSGGAGEALTALLGGQIEMLFAAIPSALPYVNSGQLRALAVTTDGKRSPALPNVPSMSEAGLAGMAVYNWFGLAGPAGMPKEIVDLLHAQVAKALAVPAVKERFTAQGAEVVGSNPQEFAAFIRNELQRWAGAIKLAGITPE